MAKMAAWVGVRVDRITERWDRFADAVSARWDRSLDRIAIRWDRFAETVSAPYVRALDRIVDLWDRFAEAKERLTESLFVGWDRLSNRLRGRRVTVRSAGERPRRRVVGWIPALALAAIVGVASLATLSALRGTGGERSAANDLSRGESSGTTVDRPGVEAAPEEQPPASDGSSTRLGAFRTYRDERTGYRFSYPSGWEVSVSEGITRLADATGEVVISFRTAPSGSLHDFSERLVGILASRYAPLDLVVRDDAETPRGEPSLVLGGRATDTDGSPINFMIVAIEGPDRNRAVTVRFSADSDLLDVSSWVRRIAGSFTISTVATAA